jgi:hypothetical protein
LLAADEDSFKYETPSSTPNTSITNGRSGGSNSSDFVDLSDAADFDPPAAGRRGRKRENNAPSPVPNESFDLTDGSFEFSPRKRSRRAADEVAAQVVDTIELSEEVTENTDLNKNGIQTRSKGRGRTKKGVFKPPAPKPAKKAPKSKRLTYKQALAVVYAPIPQLQENQAKNKPQVSEPPQLRMINLFQSTPRPAPSTVQSCDVDLTGDVVLTDKHSSAPLFQKQSAIQETVQESSSEDDDEDDDFDMDAIKVKVKTKQGIKPFKYRRHQRYYDLIKTISELDKIPMSDIFLFDGDRRIQPDDTPNSSGYKISTILVCRVMESKPGEYKQLTKKNRIELKFQSDKWKKPIALKVSKFDNFKTALDILCEQMPQFKPEQFSLEFDGDHVTLTQTPIDLDFDGGEILDCRVKV